MQLRRLCCWLLPVAREVRKTVTVVFCDLVGSTALGEQTDPEALRALLGRYFERMSGIVESHGGTVEKFIGDAVLAVFGVPVVHEDDALRACRAAVEMRDALPALGIQGRIGVNTGEVVTGTAERLVTGDAVNVAARFEQAAAPGEVLIGASTHELVHGAVDAEPVEPLVLKGKSEPVPAFRLLAARAAPERRHDSLFVGRERELGLLSEAWERAVGEQRCELVTVVGEPGIGKSRLAAEALRLDRGAGGAGPLSALRGGDHLLAGRRGRSSSSTCCRPIRLLQRRSARCWASRMSGRRRRRSAGRSASCSRSRRRWWSSSTTSSGARRPSST